MLKLRRKEIILRGKFVKLCHILRVFLKKKDYKKYLRKIYLYNTLLVY